MNDQVFLGSLRWLLLVNNYVKKAIVLPVHIS
jgi:hypothetical protein